MTTARPDGKIQLVLMNASPVKVFIKKGTIVGRLESVVGCPKEPHNLIAGIGYTPHGAKPQVPVDLSTVFKLDHLTPQRSKVLEFLEIYRDIFVLPGEKLGATNLIEHKIDTGSNKPVACRQGTVAHDLQPLLNDVVNELLEDSIIQHYVSRIRLEISIHVVIYVLQ